MEHRLRLPRRQGRAGDQGDVQDRHAEGHVGLRLQHAAADVRRPGGPEGARASSSTSSGSTTTSTTTPMSARPATSTTSELSSIGRPADEREKALLAPFPGVVAPDVMDGTYKPAVSDGSGADRKVLREVLSELQAAGYELDASNTLVNKATGQPLAFEILVTTKEDERLALAYQRTLDRIGIKATIRSVDSAQFQQRRQTFDFDMTRNTWAASLSPGQRAEFPLEPGVRRHRGLVQLSRRQGAGDRRDDPGDARRADPRGLRRRGPRARPRADLRLLRRCRCSTCRRAGSRAGTRSSTRRRRRSPGRGWRRGTRSNRAGTVAIRARRRSHQDDGRPRSRIAGIGVTRPRWPRTFGERTGSTAATARPQFRFDAGALEPGVERQTQHRISRLRAWAAQHQVRPARQQSVRRFGNCRSARRWNERQAACPGHHEAEFDPSRSIGRCRGG